MSPTRDGLTPGLDFVVPLTLPDVPRIVRAFADGFFTHEATVRHDPGPSHQFNALDTESARELDFWALRTDRFEGAMFAGRRCEPLSHQHP
jgi:hypothetical protein